MIVRNPSRQSTWIGRKAPAEVREFHRSLPGYAPTPLVALGNSEVFAKVESNRLGLPAFKALGASWAIHRALREHDGPVTIATATDGNHGRAVARFARQLGHRAAIFVPDGVHPAAVQAIRDEGATVTHVRGSYDDAVKVAAGHQGSVLVQDMAWDGYEDVPGWIVDGYSTLFAEIDEQLGVPDLLVVPAGVGSLLQAALNHYRDGTGTPTVVSVEPLSAACVLRSVQAARPVTVATGVTSMAGLNCGTVSSLAWPAIRSGLDACVAVGEEDVADAAKTFAGHGVDAGPCGAASLAALSDIEAVLSDIEHNAARVVLLVTEGAAANPGVSPDSVPPTGA
jgi:diaminopropionate ammonia-lyase